MAQYFLFKKELQGTMHHKKAEDKNKMFCCQINS